MLTYLQHNSHPNMFMPTHVAVHKPYTRVFCFKPKHNIIKINVFSVYFNKDNIKNKKSIKKVLFCIYLIRVYPESGTRTVS